MEPKPPVLGLTITALLVVFIAILATSCKDKAQQSSTAKPPKRVVILQNGYLPILDQVVKGCETKLKKILGDGVVIEKKNGGGDSELIRQEALNAVTGGFDVIVPVGTPSTIKVLAVTDDKTPIVFTFVSNPADLGYSGPGTLKNTTGIVNGTGYDQILDALQKLVPKAQRLGYLLSSEPNAQFVLGQFEKRLSPRHLSIVTTHIQSAGDIPQAARSIATQIDAYLVGGDHTLVNSIDPLLDVAESFQKPVFAVDEASVSKGAVAAVVVDYDKIGEMTADYVAYVLAGANPENLALVKYETFDLVINKKACAQLGITISDALAKSSRLIEK